MDTSRGSDGAIDSRAVRQLRPTQGLHIMIWRQTWRQRWRPTRTPASTHHPTRDRETTCDPQAADVNRRPPATASDPNCVRTPRHSGQERPPAWGNYRQRGKQSASGCRSGRGRRGGLPPSVQDFKPPSLDGSAARAGCDGRGSLALQLRRRRPPAWRLEASGGRRSRASEPNRSGARDGAGRPATPDLCIAIPSIQPYPARAVRPYQPLQRWIPT